MGAGGGLYLVPLLQRLSAGAQECPQTGPSPGPMQLSLRSLSDSRTDHLPEQACARQAELHLAGPCHPLEGGTCSTPPKQP